MKKLLAFLLLIFSTEAFSQKSPQGVVDYFNLLPEDLRVFSLKQKNGKWTSISPITEEEISTVVDAKNGFIQITDEGTGGGTQQTTVVLYRKANKDAVIAVSNFSHDGVMESFDVKFFEYQNNQWKDISKQTLPQLQPTDFLKEKIDLKPYQELLRNSPIVMALPQFGTAIKANISSMYLDFKCNKKDEQYSKEACLLKSKLYTTVDLLWDKTTGKFSIGSKK
jgi:hypothetical protein